MVSTFVEQGKVRANFTWAFLNELRPTKVGLSVQLPAGCETCNFFHDINRSSFDRAQETIETISQNPLYQAFAPSHSPLCFRRGVDTFRRAGVIGC